MNGVLVDTSVWVEHFRQRNDLLAGLLQSDLVLMHPLILGEIACGTPPSRVQTLRDLASLQQAQRAGIRDTMDFVEREQLFGLGCGPVDLQLLASTLITPNTALWTRDKRLHALAERFDVACHPTGH